MKRKIPNFLICVVCILLFLTMTVHADIGPKPSVRITFEGLGDESLSFVTGFGLAKIIPGIF